MKKTLKNQDVYTLPEADSVSLVIEEGAEVWVECDRAQMDQKVAIHLKSGAHLRWMSAYAGKSEKTFTLEEGAQLDYFHHILGESEESTTIFLDGDESSVSSQTLFFGKNTDKQNLRVDHIHKGKNTRSLMISRGAVKDSAFGHFYGNIKMLPGCSGADASLQEHNLLLSKGSKIEAVPGLEIAHNEVQAAHSATLEKIDEEKLFYLQSRGLQAQEGLELLVEGFFWDALQKCPNLAFSQRIFKNILQCLSK
ncbi:MAG: SufD family Fe-S cluster assembly protein [Candidatus Gracilibacteria bacterium]|jgi:Fe-S cluster assembly scaffold protein SufB